MSRTRREFLRLGLGGSTLLATGPAVPTFLANTANVLASEPAKNPKGRVLAVPQLKGSNGGPCGKDDFGRRPYDPLSWASRHDIGPKQAAGAFLDLFVQGDDARARDAVLAAGRDGKAESLRKALQLIVHYPEYQLA